MTVHARGDARSQATTSSGAVRTLRWLPFVVMALVSLWVASALPSPRKRTTARPRSSGCCAVAVFLRPQMAPGFPAQARTGLLALADGLGD